jgi:hypothetical protein
LYAEDFFFLVFSAFLSFFHSGFNISEYLSSIYQIPFSGNVFQILEHLKYIALRQIYAFE